MANSSTTWHRSGPRVRDYWRGRESSWRRQRLLVRDPSGWAHGYDRVRFFTRYDYARLWVAQKGLCGVCDKPLKGFRTESIAGYGEVGVGRGIDPDHSHSHGLVRALVHGRCNRAVGLLDSHQALLVLNYLLKHERAMEETK